MGFKCQKCNKVSQLYEKQNSLVIEKREKTYRYYIVKVRTQKGKFEQIYAEIKPDEKDRNKQLIKEFTTHGWETVRELKICGRCSLGTGIIGYEEIILEK